MRLSYTTAFGLALACLVSADPFDLPPGFHRFAPRAEDITWEPCSTTSNATQCGRFEVPLDYQNASAGKASLAVARYPATKQPKLGTLLLNPGGPGASGVQFITGTAAKVISNATGGQYDLVSWDPRGVGLTHPRADCFETAGEEAAFWNGTIPNAGLEARGNFTDQVDLDAFYAQVPEVDSLLLKLGQKCLEYSPDTFQYVGTAAVVRDMVAMHDYLEGPDKPVNFWGLSYGTVIGIYFVNMFPDRVGRVVIDGVVDPEYWTQKPPYEFWAVSVESADEALEGFVQACATAGVGNCALASSNSTPTSLKKDLQNLIDMAYDYKKANGMDAPYGSAKIRNMLFEGMYAPSRWPRLAESLANITEFLTSHTNSSSNSKRSFEFDTRSQTISWENPTNSSAPAPDYAFQAVTCADSIDADNVTTKMVFDEIVRVSRNVSPMFGPIWGVSSFYCHRWPVRAVERFTGPFNKNLSNPIIVIGNEADPITPYISAKKVADALGDSAILVEQDDYGHASLAMHSDCTFAILQNYFTNGTLPTSDQFCGTNQVLFPGPWITKKTLSAAGTSNLAASSSSESNTGIQSELDDTKARADRLFIAVVALAAAAGLLLVSLIGSCIVGRRKKEATRVTHAVHFPTDMHDDQGHEYKTPYDGTTGGKGGGYAPVQT
ncbi:Abhydrolase domain-containing protein [Ceratobasidium sp. AG-Ba]|nr:Abhydrolase domain-containing protein [Ceratobasidium sp. AG-Ba]